MWLYRGGRAAYSSNIRYINAHVISRSFAHVVTTSSTTKKLFMSAKNVDSSFELKKILVALIDGNESAATQL